MRSWITLSALLLTVLAATGGRTAENTGPGLKQAILGTWKLSSAKYGGRESKIPELNPTVKHVTPAAFMWASRDQDGRITRSIGGSYTLKDGTYTETPEYGYQANFEALRGKPQTFPCRIEGDRWYHEGKLANGLTVEEVWQRVQPAEAERG